MNIIPPFLKAGDTIGIAATARWITPQQLAPVLELIASWGFKTKLAENIHFQHFQLAGTVEQRVDGFQKMLDDPEVNAILIVRGGYGTVHITDHLDFSKIEQHPKWICGYSDITVLHAEMNRLGIASIHSTMPISFPVATPIAIENLRKALIGELTGISWNVNSDQSFKKENVAVVGGNLSVLFSLLGSKSLRQPQKNQLIFLEDVDEMFYHIDRMITGLKRAGFFEKSPCVLIGGLTMMKDNTKVFGFDTENPWGISPEDTIRRLVGENDLKATIFNFPAGHQNDNRAFYLGVNSDLHVSNGKADLNFHV